MISTSVNAKNIKPPIRAIIIKAAIIFRSFMLRAFSVLKLAVPYTRLYVVARHRSERYDRKFFRHKILDIKFPKKKISRLDVHASGPRVVLVDFQNVRQYLKKKCTAGEAKDVTSVVF